eukprot:433547-Prymnesium_polylepis.1
MRPLSPGSASESTPTVMDATRREQRVAERDLARLRGRGGRGACRGDESAARFGGRGFSGNDSAATIQRQRFER